jgi:hypothetical protein
VKRDVGEVPAVGRKDVPFVYISIMVIVLDWNHVRPVTFKDALELRGFRRHCILPRSAVSRSTSFEIQSAATAAECHRPSASVK